MRRLRLILALLLALSLTRLVTQPYPAAAVDQGGVTNLVDGGLGGDGNGDDWTDDGNLGGGDHLPDIDESVKQMPNTGAGSLHAQTGETSSRFVTLLGLIALALAGERSHNLKRDTRSR